MTPGYPFLGLVGEVSPAEIDKAGKTSGYPYSNLSNLEDLVLATEVSPQQLIALASARIGSGAVRSLLDFLHLRGSIRSCWLSELALAAVGCKVKCGS